MNWDISFFKHVPMGGSRRLQFRVELYNAFNTDQWTATIRRPSAMFHYVTGAQTDTNFGRITGCDVQRAADPARRAVHVLTAAPRLQKPAGDEHRSSGLHE